MTFTGNNWKVLAVLCKDYWMQTHLIPTLQQFYASVEVFFYRGMAHWNDPVWIEQRAAEATRLVTRVRELKATAGIDAVFMIAYDDFLSPAAARRIRDLGVHLIDYNVDMSTQWYRCLRIAPLCSVVGAGSLDHMESLERSGAFVAYAPMAANTDHFRPLSLTKQFDVAFCGGYTPSRADAVAAATDVSSSVAVCGSGWTPTAPESRVQRPHWRKYVNDAAYIYPRWRAEGRAMFRTSDWGKRVYDKGDRLSGARYLGTPADIVNIINETRIVIGVNQRWGSINSQKGYLCPRLRDFEVPACGAMYLAQWHRELPLYFRVGQEIDTWFTLDELRYKIDYYLSHAQEREAIARAGRERVVSSHQWQSRFAVLTECALRPGAVR